MQRGRHLIELPDRVQSTIMQGVEKGIVPVSYTHLTLPTQA